MTEVENLNIMIQKEESKQHWKKSNMSLVKLLPKAFLALGTNYGIDYGIFPHLYFWATKVETHAWNSAFSFCVITDSGSKKWQGISRAACGDLRNHSFVATYLNLLFPGKASTRGSIGCPKPKD